ncbi:MAG TPA: hypothetical protein VGJ84_09745 [Polyangiaceae bacterium]
MTHFRTFSLLFGVLLVAAGCGGKGGGVSRGSGAGAGGQMSGTGARGFGGFDGSIFGTGGSGFGDAALDSSGFGTMDSGTGGGGDGGLQLVITVEGGAGLKVGCDVATLVVSGQPKTNQCWVELADGTRATNVVWATDDTRVGSIASDGVFRANGYVGGVVKITATVANTPIHFDITVDVVIQNNTGGISTADIAKLSTGGTADPQFGWLYPYDKTVFPRGLPPPVLQFSGSCAADATYLKITLPHFTYEQAAKGSVPTQITIPDGVWKGMTMSTLGSDWVNVSASKLCAQQASALVTENWLIAPGKIKGIVYYNSYQSYLATTNGNGAVLRVRLGGQAEMVSPPTQCTVCHSVSADGVVLATAISYNSSAIYDLDLAGNATRRATVPNGVWSLPALTRDGSRAMTFAGGVFGLNPNNGNGSSKMVDTTTGATILAPSFTGSVQKAWMPSFSPDDTRIAFTNADLGTGYISVMEYDGSQNPPLFSNLRTVAQGSTWGWLAWPTFLPDSQALLYHDGQHMWSIDRSTKKLAELRLVDIQSGTVNVLKALNGYTDSGATYLPYSTLDDEEHVNYEPTALPVALGGYYWVMFSSRRSYGNTIAPGGTVAGGDTAFVKGSWSPSPRQKLWIAAIDIDYVSKADPSHPAFYLEGQEVAAGNLRPFAAVEPCRPDGTSCESGVDCCSGFCRETSRASDGTPILQCVPAPPGACANFEEACVTVADCCDQTNLCIANRCTIPTPPIF